MLKSEEQPEKRRGLRPWWLLLLVPPVALLAWALVGIDVRLGSWELVTGCYQVLSDKPLGFSFPHYYHSEFQDPARTTYYHGLRIGPLGFSATLMRSHFPR